MYPLMARLNGRPALVVGAGRVGTRKIMTLVAAGARITVVAPQATEEVKGLAGARRISWKQRSFRRRDFRGMFLAVAATGCPKVDSRVFRIGERRRCFVNSVDDPEHCSFFVPATISRGKAVVAISTSGAAPYLARRLKESFDRMLPSDLGESVERIGEIRRSALEAAPNKAAERAKIVEAALEPEISSIIEELER